MSQHCKNNKLKKSFFTDTSDDVMLEVRDHIEKVVETLVGDNLDESSVIRLANHPSCKFYATLRTFAFLFKNLIVIAKIDVNYLIHFVLRYVRTYL